jgi:L-aminopeptidase/D-esterase-like protein
MMFLGTGVGWSADQSALVPVTTPMGPVLQFDWPLVSVGIGQYEEGPTGVTVFRFGRKVMAAVDVRGGSPGTVNTDYLRLGYDKNELDAIVFAGGSWYGLEATTAVASALKDDGVRSGEWSNLALTAGAIVYDFGDRRLNEIYPDKRLAQAAVRAARPGVFPQGAQGAGRYVKTGVFSGCGGYSGQGGAFRQIGDLKIAAFAVVNAGGVVTRRDGSFAACYPDPAWGSVHTTAELLARITGTSLPDAARRNTTVSLVITNQKMSPAQLQRLAVQVHTSMARGIQPFATEGDGDVLYAVSTGEIEPPADAGGMAGARVGLVAAEVMWDAVLASVPEQVQAATPDPDARPAAATLDALVGTYRFSEFAGLRVTVAEGRLWAQATGARDVYSIGRTQPVLLVAARSKDKLPLYTVPGRYPLNLRFETDGRLVLNPGTWQQVGRRL